MKTAEMWVRKGNLDHGGDCIWLYGTKEMRNDRDLGSFCASTWTRKTGIRVERGKPKHIRITFEEIANEDC